MGNERKFVILFSFVFLFTGTSQAIAQSETLTTKTIWLEQAIPGAKETIVKIWEKAIQESLDKMPEVKKTLKNRASGINKKAEIGHVTALDLYKKIPIVVRLAGEKEVLDYLENRHVSHIKSVKNHKELIADPKNLVFEIAEDNLKHGFNDMKYWDKLKVKFHNVSASLKATPRTLIMTKVAGGSIIGILIELPITGTVETLNVINDQKTMEEAMKDAAKSIGIVGLFSVTTVGAFTGLSALGLTMGTPILVPLAVVGGSVYVLVSSKRIWQALDEETRSNISKEQASVQKTIREHALIFLNQTSTKIDTVEARIKTKIDALRWWE